MSIKLLRKIYSRKVQYFLEMIIKNCCKINKSKGKYNNKAHAILQKKIKNNYKKIINKMGPL